MKAPDKAVMRIAAKSGAPTGNFNGVWKNELGSIMTLKVQGNIISGSYKTAESGGGGPLPPHPLVGCVDGNLISFTVNWIDKAAITAWVGQLTDATGIFTLWQMTLKVNDPPHDIWESVLAGSDTFIKVS